MSQRGFGQVMAEKLAEMAPGLKNMVPELKAEAQRLGRQGALEMAQALFNGAGFTPYGPGQYTPTPKVEKDGLEQEVQKAEPNQEQERERGGREM